jgi:hypothetical protein
MLDPRSTTPERAAYAALFYRPDQTGPHSTCHDIDRRASAACASIQTKRKKQAELHADFTSMQAARAATARHAGPNIGYRTGGDRSKIAISNAPLSTPGCRHAMLPVTRS